jgi:hypothetical protein
MHGSITYVFYQGSINGGTGGMVMWREDGMIEGGSMEDVEVLTGEQYSL